MHAGLDLGPFRIGLAVGDVVATGVDGHADLMAGFVLRGRGGGVGGGCVGACCCAVCRVLRPGFGHSVAQHAAGLDTGLALAAGKGGGRVVEADVALAVPGPDGTLVAFVAGFGAPGVSGHFTGVLVGRQVVAAATDRVGAGAGAGDLGADPAVLAQGGAHVGAAHLEGGQRVAVLHPGGADVGTLGGLELAVGAIDPVLAATLVHLVGDAQRDRVQVLVQRRYGAVEQDAAAEGLEGVVDEAGEGLGLQDACRGVAVAHHHHHLLGAQYGVGSVGDGVGAGDAAAGKFLDDLTQAVVGSKAVEEAFLALDVATDAGHGAFVLAQVTVLESGDLALAGALGETAAGGDVTIQQVVAVLVQAHVQAAVALRVEAHQRAVTVDGVPALGVQVAEQAVVVGVFAVVGHGQQHVAADLAFQEEGALGAGRALAVAAAARPVLDLVLEAVAGTGLIQAQRTVTTQRDDALDEAGGDHVAQFGHEVDLAFHTHGAGRDVQFHGLRGRGGQQKHLGVAIGQRHAHAGFQRVQISRKEALLIAPGARQLQASGRDFDVDEALTHDALVVGVEGADAQLHGALAIGGHVVSVHLDRDAGDAVLQRLDRHDVLHDSGRCRGQDGALQVGAVGFQRGGVQCVGPAMGGAQCIDTQQWRCPAQRVPLCAGCLLTGTLDLFLIAAHLSPLCAGCRPRLPCARPPACRKRIHGAFRICRNTGGCPNVNRLREPLKPHRSCRVVRLATTLHADVTIA